MAIDPLPPFSSPEVMRKFLEMLEGLPDTPDIRDVREQTRRDLQRLEEFLTGGAIGEPTTPSSQVAQRGSRKSPFLILANVLDWQADEETEPQLRAQKRFRAEALRELAGQEPESQPE